MSIKIAGQDDFEEVYRLYYQILKLHAERRPDIFKEGEVITKQMYNECLNDPNHVFLLWTENNKICGLCHMLKMETKDVPICIDITTAFIEDFVVDSAFRHMGIGRKLFNASKDQAKKWNADSLELNVWTVNEEAIKFYSAVGLAPKSIRMELKIN